MNRIEHLEWCKNRALSYCDKGEVEKAFSSLLDDLAKHEGTSGHFGIQIGFMQMIGGMLSSPEQMRKFIEGFN